MRSRQVIANLNKRMGTGGEISQLKRFGYLPPLNGLRKFSASICNTAAKASSTRPASVRNDQSEAIDLQADIQLSLPSSFFLSFSVTSKTVRSHRPSNLFLSTCPPSKFPGAKFLSPSPSPSPSPSSRRQQLRRKKYLEFTWKFS